MRRVAAVIGTAAVVLWAATAFAQKPDFSGSWAPDADKNPAAQAGGGRGRGGGGPMTLKQDATSLTRTTQGRNGEQTTTYKLDGSEQEVTMGQATAKVTAKWDGNNIVISTTRDMNGTNVTTTTTYSMEGSDLVVTTNGQGRDGSPMTNKVYYKKGGH